MSAGSNPLPLGKAPPILVNVPINEQERKNDYLAMPPALTNPGPEGPSVAPVSLSNAAGQGGKVDSILGEAKSALGTPYKWGGNDLKTGVDCSGLVQQVYSHNGIQLPRTSQEQAKVTQPIPAAMARPGDLVFYDNNGHVGIYLGNGQMLDAPHTGAVVRIENLWGGAQFHRVTGGV